MLQNILLGFAQLASWDVLLALLIGTAGGMIVGALPGQVIHATVIAECAGLKAACTVYVPGFQATYLTENLYDPEYVDEWDAEQARLAWEAANATIAPVASQAPTA